LNKTADQPPFLRFFLMFASLHAIALGLADHCSRWASGTHRTVARTTSGRHTDGGQRTSLAK
jgi:hypothetical protein